MLPQTRTIRYGSIIFRGCITWNYLQNDFKTEAPVCFFKKHVKSRSGEVAVIVKFLKIEKMLLIHSTLFICIELFYFRKL